MMSLSLKRFSRDSDTGQIAKGLETDGAVIVESFATPEQTDRLSSDFAPHLDQAEWCNTDTGVPDSFHGHHTKRLHGLLARSSMFGELLVDPLMAALCDHFLKPRCSSYRISTGELMQTLQEI